jgi:CopG antitoxin of type II toxin-antitoxin system
MSSMSKMKNMPKLKSEKGEADFWLTNDSTEYESDETKVKFARPKKKLVSHRLDDKTISQLIKNRGEQRYRISSTGSHVGA